MAFQKLKTHTNMPQFYIHAPKTQSDMLAMRMAKKTLPIGTIGNGRNFAYGYDGEKYYVTEGVLEYFVTRTHLSLEEAKQLYLALEFSEASEPKASEINIAVQSARKSQLHGDVLFWHFVDSLAH